MKILSCRAVILSESSLAVNSDSGLSAGSIEPVGDISSCGLDERRGIRIIDVFLDYMGQIVDFSEEGYPTIVRCVVVAHFLACVISLLSMRNWEELFLAGFGRITHLKLYKQCQCAYRTYLSKSKSKSEMKGTENARMTPSLFHSLNEYENQPISSKAFGFQELSNTINSKNSHKKERKPRTPKSFLGHSDEQNNKHEHKQPVNQEFKLAKNRDNRQKEHITLSNKAQGLFDFDLEEVTLAPVSHQQPVDPKEDFVPEIRLANNQSKVSNIDLSSSSEPQAEKSAKIIPSSIPQISQKDVIKEEIEDVQAVTAEFLFRKIAQNNTLQCIIRRDKKNQDGVPEYNIYFEKSLKHILTIKKESMCQYVLYLRQSKGYSFTYTKIATLESNFLGSTYTLLKSNQKYSHLTVSYQTNFLGLNGPRKIITYIPKEAPLPFENLSQAYEDDTWKPKVQRCMSKSAKWSQKANSFILSFKGRALKSSIKNFVITDQKESEDKYFIIFGKAAPEVYNLDIQWPFSLIQGVSVAISTFERKLTCD